MMSTCQCAYNSQVTSAIYFIKTPLNQRCELIAFVHFVHLYFILRTVFKLVYRAAAFAFSIQEHLIFDLRRLHDIVFCFDVLLTLCTAYDRSE